MLATVYSTTRATSFAPVRCERRQRTPGNRQKIHVVNGRSISLGHAEVKSPNRRAKSPLDGLSIELVKQLSAIRHDRRHCKPDRARSSPSPGRRRTVSRPGSVKGCPKGRRRRPDGFRSAQTIHLDLGSLAGLRLLFSFGVGLPLEPRGVFAADASTIGAVSI